MADVADGLPELQLEVVLVVRELEYDELSKDKQPELATVLLIHFVSYEQSPVFLYYLKERESILFEFIHAIALEFVVLAHQFRLVLLNTAN